MRVNRALFFTALIPCPAAAAFAAPKETSRVRAELISEATSFRPGSGFWVALRLRMDKGWHTYWKNPGDSGLATRIRWTLPEGFTAGPIHWPYPSRFGKPPVVNYGYEREVLLLVRIETGPLNGYKEGDRVRLSARADWLECSDICVPGRADLSFELPFRASGPRTDPIHESLFDLVRARIPAKPAGWLMKAAQNAGTVRLIFTPPSPLDIESAEFFPEMAGLFDESVRPKFRRDGKSWALEYARVEGSEAPEKLEGVLVLKEWGGRVHALEAAVPMTGF